MNLGTLNREITVERKSVAQDATFGSEVVTWEPLALLPGSPEVAEKFAAEVYDLPPSRAEGVFRGDLMVSRNLVRVRMRWRNDIDSTMRIIVHGDTDRRLQIIGGPAEYGGRKVGLEMLCEEVSSDA